MRPASLANPITSLAGLIAPRLRVLARPAMALALAFAFAAVAATAWPDLAAAQTKGGASIEGSWRLVINVAGAPEAENSLATFTGDGSYIQGTSGGEGTGHGAWRQIGDNVYALTFEQLSRDEESGAMVRVKVWTNITVDASGNALQAPFRFSVMLLDGTVVDQGTGIATGTRIVVEPF
jgi:hypothetical protein